jgi:hypothetical protein
MKKEFIPYEQALALKELGFDEPCFGYYLQNKRFISYEERRSMPKQTKDAISAPTFSQAFRWFREQYNLHHIVIWDSETNNFDAGLFGELFTPFLDKDIIFTTYEEAELECLKRLIEIIKSK